MLVIYMLPCWLSTVFRKVARDVSRSDVFLVGYELHHPGFTGLQKTKSQDPIPEFWSFTNHIQMKNLGRQNLRQDRALVIFKCLIFRKIYQKKFQQNGFKTSENKNTGIFTQFFANINIYFFVVDGSKIRLYNHLGCFFYRFNNPPPRLIII